MQDLILFRYEKAFDFIYKAPFDNGLTEYEFDHVFIGNYQGNMQFDSLRVPNDQGSWGRSVDTTVVFDPKNIRSRFAAFDPMQRNSANLLAGGLGGAIGLNSLADILNQEQYQ